MTYQQRIERTLATLDPDFAALVRRVLDHMASIGHPMVPYDGHRTRQQQELLYRQGRFGNTGDIITDCDGVIKVSYHQSGRAVDCAFLLLGKGYRYGWALSWELSRLWSSYGEYAESLGLTWGGRWKRPVDRPHIEMRKP